MPPVFAYSWLLRLSLTRFQKTFTVGEAMIMTQAVTLFGVMAIVKLTFDVEDVNETDEEMDFIYTIIYVGVLYLLKSTKNIHIY